MRSDPCARSGEKIYSVNIECRGREEDTVEPVQHTAMTRKDSSGILYSEASLKERFEQVPQLTQEPNEQCRHYAVNRREFGEKNGFRQKRARDTSRQPAQGTLNTLVGTDKGVQLPLPDSATHVECRGIPGHDYDQKQEDPLDPMGHRSQQNQVIQEQRNIEYAHEILGGFHGGALDVADSKQGRQAEKKDGD